MSVIVKHLPWIAPTAAILAVGSGLTDQINISFGEQNTQAAVEQSELVISPAAAETGAAVAVAAAAVAAAANVEPVTAVEPVIETVAAAEPVPVVEPVVEIAAAAQAQEAPVIPLVDAGDVSAQLTALLKENNVTDYTVGVTRNTGFSIDSLLAATGDALDEQDAIADAQEAPAVGDNGLASGQVQLADARQCVEDLTSLSSHARVYFPVGGLIGEPSGVDQARLLGLLADQCDGVTIQVEGHSDASGNAAGNQSLSEERAAAVVANIATSGISPDRFVVVGFGDTQPSLKTGPQPDFYYDRRVEFKVLETAVQEVSFVAPQQEEATVGPNLQVAACVSELETAIQGATIEYAPSGVAVNDTDLALAVQLAGIAQDCPEARLRLVGHHSEDPGANENAATGRLRAIVLQTLLVSEGFAGDQFTLGAPSDARPVQGVSDSRLDFEIVLEEL